MTTYIKYPSLTVTFAGSTLTDVIDCRIQVGYDKAVAQCDITVTALPAGALPWDVVSVTCGATSGTAAKRFEGYFLDAEYQMYPPQIVLKCRGYLCLAQIYLSDDRIDMSGYSADILEDPPTPTGRTDVEMTGQVFSICGIEDDNGITTSIGSFSGTTRKLGLVSRGKGFKWEQGEAGLAFIQRLDEATGCRTFDTFSGVVTRMLISTTPGTSVATFTEGVDIARASNSMTMLEIYNRIVVTGWNGDKTERTYTAEATSPWLYRNAGAEAWYREKSYSSAMIEHATAGSAGLGCDEVANRLLAENNRRLFKVQHSTPLDTVIEPGDTITIVSSHTGVNQKFWVQAVDVSCGRGWIQNLTCLGTVAEPT